MYVERVTCQAVCELRLPESAALKMKMLLIFGLITQELGLPHFL